jgi:hypothetical protein
LHSSDDVADPRKSTEMAMNKYGTNARAGQIAELRRLRSEMAQIQSDQPDLCKQADGRWNSLVARERALVAELGSSDVNN